MLTNFNKRIPITTLMVDFGMELAIGGMVKILIIPLLTELQEISTTAVPRKLLR